jgi:hypothetical protein
MTKQEKIKELKNAIREEYEAFAETPEIKPDDLKNSSAWLSFRGECDNSDEVEEFAGIACQRIKVKIKEESEGKSGCYELFFYMKRAGDIDFSEAGEQRRKKVEDFNQKMHKSMVDGIAAIEAEYAGKE